MYNSDNLQLLLEQADTQMKAMLMFALNCGFGPKDNYDLTWDTIDGERVTPAFAGARQVFARHICSGLSATT